MTSQDQRAHGVTPGLSQNYARRTADHQAAFVQPYPPADSPLRQLAREGHWLHHQLIGMWAQGRKRLPDPPHRFRDTHLVVADFSQQGLDVILDEFSLSTGQSPQGLLSWVAQTRHETYYTSFV